MTQIILNIPDNKLSFFMQLIKEFNYIKIEEPDNSIADEHKQLVRTIKKNTKPEQYIEATKLFKDLDKELL